MEQAKIRPSVTLYSPDPSLSNLVWLITSATATRMPILVQFGWVGNSPKYMKFLWLFVTFCSVFFFVHMPGANTHERICMLDGSKRVKSGKDVPFGGFIEKFSPPPLISPKFQKIALRKQFFTQNTYKYWRKRSQNLYSNRKQPMGISNLGLKIWPEVVF